MPNDVFLGRLARQGVKLPEFRVETLLFQVFGVIYMKNFVINSNTTHMYPRVINASRCLSDSEKRNLNAKRLVLGSLMTLAWLAAEAAAEPRRPSVLSRLNTCQ
jgi:hypothetical protein